MIQGLLLNVVAMYNYDRPEEFLQCLGDAMRDLKMQYEAFVQV